VPAREVLRRSAIWSLLVGYLVVAICALVLSGDLFVIVGWTAFPVIGALILIHRPGHNVGRVLLSIGVLWAIVAGSILAIELLGAQSAEWLRLSLSVVGNGAGVFAYVALMLVVLIFPTGRVETTAGRVLLLLLVALTALTLIACLFVPVPTSDLARPWLLEALGTTTGPDGFFTNLAVPVLIAAELLELSVRWNRSDRSERFQYRWFAVGCAIVIALLIGDAVWQSLSPTTHGSAADVGWLVVLPVNAIPIAIGFAILRYGLYSIGRVVSRAVSYAVVSAAVVAVYSLVVTSVTWVMPAASALPVAIATLAAATLFLPILRRVQHHVDRHFDRQHYDAQRVVAAFGERLRTGIDPTRTVDDLQQAVETTFQPASLGLWTREVLP
jgi:hypothetical protein